MLKGTYILLDCFIQYMQSAIEVKTQANATNKEETNCVSWQALHLDW